MSESLLWASRVLLFVLALVGLLIVIAGSVVTTCATIFGDMDGVDRAKCAGLALVLDFCLLTIFRYLWIKGGGVP